MVNTKEQDIIIEFTFGLDNPSLEDKERLNFAKNLLPQLRKRDEVKKADRAENLDLETGSKSVIDSLIGMLTTKIPFKHFKGFLGFLGDRLKDKSTLKGSIKIGDNEVKFEGIKSKDLPEFEKTALNLIEAMSKEKDVQESSIIDRSE